MAQRRGSAERVWRARLERYRRSELTVGAFCEREGVSTASFHAWRRRLDAAGVPGVSSGRPRPSASAVTDSPLFVPVSVKPATAEVRIVLPGGAVVHLPPDVDERLLRCCIRAAAEPGRAGEAGPC